MSGETCLVQESGKMSDTVETAIMMRKALHAAGLANESLVMVE